MNIQIKETAKKYSIITLGSAMLGFGISCFMAPNNIISGGVSGIATVVNHFTGFPLGVFALLLNIPIFVWGIIKLGKSLGAATLYGTVTLSVFIDLFAVVGPVTDDILLATLFGGLICGVGHGIGLYVGATTGGVDIVAKIVQLWFRHMQLGKLLLFIDVVVITFAMLIYRNFNIGLYSIVCLWLTTVSIDTILEGFNFGKLIFVISDYSDEIAKVINNNMERGATFLHGYGSYTGNPKNIIMCTIKKREIPVVKDIIKSYDKNAFVLITDVREVLGEGFLKHE